MAEQRRERLRARASAVAAPCGSRARRRGSRAPARTPRSIAWSVAVSQACSAIMTSIAAGAKLRRSPCTKRSPSQCARAATPLQNSTSSARSSTPVTSGDDAEAASQVLVDGEGEVALAAAEVDDARRAGHRRRQARRRRAHGPGPRGTCRSAATCAPSPAPGGGSRRRGRARRARADRAAGGAALAIVRLARPRSLVRPTGRSDMPPQRRSTLLADEQLAVVAVRVQRRMRERWPDASRRGARRRRRSRRRSRGCGDVARRVRGDERQRRPAFEDDAANADRLRSVAPRARLGQDQRLERTVVASCANRVEERSHGRGSRRRSGGLGCEGRRSTIARGVAAIVGRRQRRQWRNVFAALPCSPSPTTRRSSSP